jgi:hypothetical protein
MHVHVIAEHALVHERDAAEMARKAALRGDVQAPVIVKRLSGLELASADVAHGGNFAFLVHCSVLAEQLLARERGPARAAFPSANRA